MKQKLFAVVMEWVKLAALLHRCILYIHAADAKNTDGRERCKLAVAASQIRIRLDRAALLLLISA